MTGSTAPATDVVTDRLVLRRWTRAEFEAVLAGQRAPHWAEDFPAEGDRVVAGLVAQLDPVAGNGHRLIVEGDTGLVVGSLGWFWPPGNGALEIGYGTVP